MILRLRRSIAIVLAVAVTLFTLGRVRVDASGGPGAPESARDPGTAAIEQPGRPSTAARPGPHITG